MTQFEIINGLLLKKELLTKDLDFIWMQMVEYVDKLTKRSTKKDLDNNFGYYIVT